MYKVMANTGQKHEMRTTKMTVLFQFCSFNKNKQGWHHRVLVNRVLSGFIIKPDASETHTIGFIGSPSVIYKGPPICGV
jgi:hypothetical protein